MRHRRTALVVSAVALLAPLAASARPPSCAAAKLRAIGVAEAGELACLARAVGKGGPASAPSACAARARRRFAAAFARAGSCAGSADACGAVVDACSAAVRGIVPDAGPGACTAVALAAAGRQARRELACYAKGAAHGTPVSPACLARAQRALARAVRKAGRAAACSGVASDVAAQVDAACVGAAASFESGVVSGLCPGATTTPTSTTTTTLPSSGSLPTVSLGGCASSGYVAAATIGGQTFDVIADSGSTTVAVASASCPSSGCSGLSPRYTPGATAAATGLTASSTYGDGSSWSGRIFSDRVSLADASAQVRMAISTIDTAHAFFGPSACTFVSVPNAAQGIFGLGGPSLAVPGTDAYVDLLGAPLGTTFAVRLCGSGGSLWLGGYDAAAAQAAPTYTPMVAGSAYYAVSLSDLRVGGSSLGFGAAAFGPTLVDIGTTALVLPNAAFAAFASTIAAEPAFAQNFAGGASWFSGGFCDTPSQGLTKAQLDAALPPVTLALPGSAGGTFTIDLPATESYLLQQDDAGGTAYYCPGIEPAGKSSPTILGANALHTLLTVFDRQQQRIGFAPVQGCAPLGLALRSRFAAPAPASRPAPPYRRHAAR